MHRHLQKPSADVARAESARHRERLRRAGRSQRAPAPGQGHRVVLHRPAGFSDASECSGRRDRGDPRRQARLHAVRRHRRAARCGRQRHGRAPRLDIRPDDVVIGAGAKPFIAYAIASVTDYGAGDEVIYPGTGIPDLRIADRRQRRGAGADLPARVARLCVRSARTRSQDHAEDAAPDPQHAAQSHRRHSQARRPRRDRRISCAGIRRSGSTPTRSTRASRTTVRSSRSPRCRECTSGRSSPTARPRPGR